MVRGRHSRPLFRLAFRMTGNQQAEDVVQESFLRARDLRIHQ